MNAVTTASGNRVHAKKTDTLTLCGREWTDDQRSDLEVDCEGCKRRAIVQGHPWLLPGETCDRHQAGDFCVWCRNIAQLNAQ